MHSARDRVGPPLGAGYVGAGEDVWRGLIQVFGMSLNKPPY